MRAHRSCKHRNTLIIRNEVLNEIIMDEIRGHDIRTRCHPKFELNESDISTYSKFEKMYQSQHMIHQLADEKNDIYTDKNSLLKITQKYYKKLFKSSKTNSFKQQKLLKNAVKIFEG